MNLPEKSKKYGWATFDGLCLKNEKKAVPNFGGLGLKNEKKQLVSFGGLCLKNEKNRYLISVESAGKIKKTVAQL